MSIRRMQRFSKSPFLNSDFVYQQLLKLAERYFSESLSFLEKNSLSPDHWLESKLFCRRPRLVEALYHEWLARFLKAM